MKKIKVILDFVKLSVAKKIAFYRNVLTQLTDNVVYPNPDVSLAEAKAAVDALESSLLVAHDGGRTAVSMMHQNEQSADAIFYTLAAYVDRIAQGDEAKILSSGFHQSKQPVLTPKAVLSVNDGNNSGSVKLVAKAVEKAGSYIWQYAKDPLSETASDWIVAGTSTRSSLEISGLSVASKYYFRVAAVTPNGTMDFCPPVLKVVI